MGWLSGWRKRKRLTIGGSVGGAQTDYLRGIRVYYGSGSDGTEIMGGVTYGKVYCESLCKMDFGDIRFTQADGETLLGYWMLDKTDNTSALFWVETDTPVGPNTVDIYMYLENAGATSISDSTLNPVTNPDFEIDYTGWILNLDDAACYGNAPDIWWKETGLASMRLRTRNSGAMGNGAEITQSVNIPATGYNLWYSAYCGYDEGGSDNNDICKATCDIGGVNFWDQNFARTTGTGEYNNQEDISAQSGPKTVKFRNERVAAGGGWYDARHLYIDYVLIRKYVNPEPTFDSWGPLEEPSQDLAAGFTVGQDIRDLAAGFTVGQDSQDLSAGFLCFNAGEVNLPALFYAEPIQANLPARLRVTKYYDLEGTGGIAFYWWGAANPVEAMNQLILESPTGFWYTDFYDGPAAWRLVEIPWGSFTWVSAPQRRLEPHRYWPYPPDQSQIDAFIWTVHTHGLRRLDYVYAYPRVPDASLSAKLSVRNSASQSLGAGFMIRQVASPELKAGFWVNQGILDLPSKFVIATAGVENFSFYSEVDAAGLILRSGNKVTWTAMRRDALAYIYKDFGADFFGDFEFDFTCVTTNVEAGGSASRPLMAPIAVTNHLDPMDGLGDLVGEAALAAYIGENMFFDTVQDWNIWQHQDGGGAIYAAGANRLLGTFYCTFGRKGTNCYLKVYSDAARTVLLDDLSIVGSTAHNYRYIMAAISWNNSYDGSDHSSGYLENLNIKQPSRNLACGFDIA